MDTQQHLMAEKEQLDARLEHLREQLAYGEYVIIPGEEQSRRALQCDLMQKYSEVLGERIRLFGAEVKPSGEVAA